MNFILYCELQFVTKKLKYITETCSAKSVEEIALDIIKANSCVLETAKTFGTDMQRQQTNL